eukprot:1119435-Rhodomonas_salina.2
MSYPSTKAQSRSWVIRQSRRSDRDSGCVSHVIRTVHRGRACVGHAASSEPWARFRSASRGSGPRPRRRKRNRACSTRRKKGKKEKRSVQRERSRVTRSHKKKRSKLRIGHETADA